MLRRSLPLRLLEVLCLAFHNAYLEAEHRTQVDMAYAVALGGLGYAPTVIVVLVELANSDYVQHVAVGVLADSLEML